MQAKPRPARPVSAASDSTEDHLERIAELIEQKGCARVTDVAAALRVSPSTVSNMVRRLSRRGFLTYARYRGFSLTARGRAVAAAIRARHQTLAELLGLLGLAADTVEQEVEDIEHHLRPQTLQTFRQLVDFWKTHPSELQKFLRFARRK